MKSLSKRWNGLIGDKGILSFLATGFAAADITEAPGDFSIFMFSPLGAVKSSDQKSKILQVRSMFGSTKLDEESIKYFAKNDFYLLADTLAGLEEQLFTCIKCLEKLTCESGIASEGYWHGLDMLSQNKQEFIGLVHMDSLFPVKFAYLLDRAFQNFVQNLGDFHNSRDPTLQELRKDSVDNRLETSTLPCPVSRPGHCPSSFFRRLFKEKLRQKLAPRKMEEQLVLTLTLYQKARLSKISSTGAWRR
jgi:hypothetical protein